VKSGVSAKINENNGEESENEIMKMASWRNDVKSNASTHIMLVRNRNIESEKIMAAISIIKRQQYQTYQRNIWRHHNQAKWRVCQQHQRIWQRRYELTKSSNIEKRKAATNVKAESVAWRQ